MGTGDNRELSLSRRVSAFLRRLLPDDMPPPAADRARPPHRTHPATNDAEVMPLTHEVVDERPPIRCKHFNGTANGISKAGVDYPTVRMAYGPGRGWILPCVRSDNIPWRCALVDYPTEAEVEEIRREHEEFVQRAIDAAPRIFAEIEAGRCPFCGAAMTKRQVGRDVYAAPCGHRLYQGYA